MMIKAIETEYMGCRFRSRLEARWAVVFERLGIPWRYEPDAFKLRSGNYLPDFWLPSIDDWFEVKGAAPNSRERQLCADLADATGKNVFLASGDIPWVDDMFPTSGMYVFYPDGFEDQCFMFCQCPACLKVDIQFEGRANRIDCDCTYADVARNDSVARHEANARTVVAAYSSARAERFGVHDD